MNAIDLLALALLAVSVVAALVYLLLRNVGKVLDRIGDMPADRYFKDLLP